MAGRPGGESDRTRLPHRDPETGQFTAGHDGKDFSFADLEWTRIGYTVNQQANSDPSEAEDIRDLETDNSPPDDLDSNELAEMVALRVNGTLGPLGTDPVTSEPALVPTTLAQVQFGINLSEAETLGGAGLQVQAGTPNLTDTGINNIDITNAIDDPGLMVAETLQIGGSTNDDTNGGQAAGNSDRFTVVKNFAGMAHGPVLDETEDLTLFTSVRTDGSTNSSRAVNLAGEIHIGWLVRETEQGRSRFRLE